MPAPFLTTDDLTAYLGKDVTNDPGAIAALDAACATIRDVTEQAFTGGTTTAAFDGTGTDALVLPESPVNAVGTVTINGTIEPNFAFRPDGLLLRGTAGAGTRPTWPVGRGNVRVTYEHGHAGIDVPTSVRMIALQVAARYVVQGVAKRETIGDATIDYGVARRR